MSSRYSTTSDRHYTTELHSTHANQPSTTGLILRFQEGCACAWRVFTCVFVCMDFSGESSACNACGLSVLKPRCCAKEQQCLHSPICLIQAWNAMPFNDKILSGWKVCRKECVCVYVWVRVCICVCCTECEIERNKGRGRRREKNISKVRSSGRP